MLSVLVSRFCITWYRSFSSSLMAARHAQQMTTALELMQRDLEMAPAERQEWYVIEPGALIVHLPAQTIGWLLQEGKLYRAVGNYNPKTASWKTRKKQQVATHIARFESSVEHDNRNANNIIYLTVQLTSDLKPDPLVFERIIVLCNREL